ncbi:PTS sorbose transporter subunit IIC [Pontibacillus halophilus JSM 076056 = DSM 19796]|uniref:PTS sorbose transporter subunit IIC n=1 Tax=Pontibacillus halophilus JSM 076056 = DSM 19796 TaxID=1385510 RepID=A0A0A5GJR5_9BACI|nr:HPr family phosphocarrier protein [Pontibacillus halophilus]KGX92244.1 PTS sorbose transporter subunit IIC [Pontibacillus halophilus JSM 076056 = DSM 19796]
MLVTVNKPIFAESASKLVNLASGFSETILLKKDHWVVDAKSLLGVLALSLQPGDQLEIDVQGGNEAAVKQSFLDTELFQG